MPYMTKYIIEDKNWSKIVNRMKKQIMQKRIKNNTIDKRKQYKVVKYKHELVNYTYEQYRRALQICAYTLAKYILETKKSMLNKIFNIKNNDSINNHYSCQKTQKYYLCDFVEQQCVNNADSNDSVVFLIDVVKDELHKKFSHNTTRLIKKVMFADIKNLEKMAVWLDNYDFMVKSFSPNEEKEIMKSLFYEEPIYCKRLVPYSYCEIPKYTQDTHTIINWFHCSSNHSKYLPLITNCICSKQYYVLSCIRSPFIKYFFTHT